MGELVLELCFGDRDRHDVSINPSINRSINQSKQTQIRDVEGVAMSSRINGNKANYKEFV